MDLLKSKVGHGESLKDFLHGAGKSKTVPSRENFSIINTRVPVEIVRQFNLYCVMENRYKKEVFNEMVEYFLAKYLDNKITVEDAIGETKIDMDYLETTNFEIDKRFIIELKKMKVENRCSLKDMYAQIIIQFFNDNDIDMNKK
ncbi:hypothetical protein [Virgibacillus kimchii]